MSINGKTLGMLCLLSIIFNCGKTTRDKSALSTAKVDYDRGQTSPTDTSDAKVLPPPAEVKHFPVGAAIDRAVPIPGGGGLLEVSILGSSRFIVEWSKGLDNQTPLERLKYQVVVSKIGPLKTPEEIKQFGGFISPSLAGPTFYTVNDLNPDGQYFANVLVRDEVGNVAAYNAVEIKMPTGQILAASSGMADYTCMANRGGRAICWGLNTGGQLGIERAGNIGDSPDSLLLAAPPKDLPESVAKIAIGLFHTCALLTSGRVRCWGQNVFGSLGTNDEISRGLVTGSMTSVNDIFLGLSDSGLPNQAIDVVAGTSSSCAVLANGKMRCWGYQGATDARFGDQPGSMERLKDLVVSGNQPVILAMSDFNVQSAVTDSNLLLTQWGNLRLERTFFKEETVFAFAAKVIQITSNSSHHCAVTDGGALYCWGRNDSGQVGDPAILANLVSRPVQVNLNGARVKSVATGWRHTCAVLYDGALYCWGANDLGQLGYGDTLNRSSPSQLVSAKNPVDVGGLATDSVFVGRDHTCASVRDDVIYCWGKNSSGQLGNGSVIDSPIPLIVKVNYR